MAEDEGPSSDKAMMDVKGAPQFDKGIYDDPKDKEKMYDTTIEPDERDMQDETVQIMEERRIQALAKKTSVPSTIFSKETINPSHDPLSQEKKTVRGQNSDYQNRVFTSMKMTPARKDPFATPAQGDVTPKGDQEKEGYREVMARAQLSKEKHVLRKEIESRAKEEEQQQRERKQKKSKRRWDQSGADWSATPQAPSSKRSRWDSTPAATPGGSFGTTPGATPGGVTPVATPGVTPGGRTPGQTPGQTPGGQTPSGITPGGQTPSGHTPGGQTPGGQTPGGQTPGGHTPGVTPGGASTPAASQWEQTPAAFGVTPGGVTPGWGATPSGITPAGGMTPGMTPGGRTPGGRTPGRTPAGGRTPGLGWAETPAGGRTPGFGGATPFGQTPAYGATPSFGQTPGFGTTPFGQTPSGKASRWDETPDMVGKTPTHTPSGRTPSKFTPGGTPAWTPNTPNTTPGTETAAGIMTPLTPGVPRTPEQMSTLRILAEIDARNRPMDDLELDELLPKDGYQIVPPPASYVKTSTPISRMSHGTPTPTPFDTGAAAAYIIPGTPANAAQMGVDVVGGGEDQGPDGLPPIKQDDMPFFQKLLQKKEEEIWDPEELKERKIMTLLLKVKNGTPPQRKNALRQLSDKAREFGAGPLFNKILPLLMSPTLEDQERHLLVKVIDRVLYKLDDLVRPYAHKILVVIEPLLIDEDYYARVEGREIIANLSKAAGLATMISTMRPDIDNMDEYVRNTTARAFSVVASALGIPSLLPFLSAVCQSKKSWQARHTGIKIVQQIAILMGCAVLPHLQTLIDTIEHGLEDEQSKVRTITALALAALAEAAAPYGIESFDAVLRPLWHGIHNHRGKTRAAFLKAIGYIIPLMDAEYASYYTREVMPQLIQEFASPDEEMKKIVLKVVKQCVATEGVEAAYVKAEILPDFFKNFWNRRMALDRRNYRQLVETTVEIANKVGGGDIIQRIVEDLRDENETYRKMVMETIDKTIASQGVADISEKLEEQLIDGILYAFQEQTAEDSHVTLSGFGTVVNSLGERTKPYLAQISAIVKFRLNNKSARVRQQAADLIGRIAPVMKVCNELALLKHLGKVLFEFLGEAYPEVLGSILGGLKAVVNVVGMQDMDPPIKEILPRLTPIMKNRHEKVQENCIDLVGRIADKGSEFVPAQEWMRIAHDLLDMLKAHKKGIKRAAVNTFGYIAKAVGPQDVLEILLNNLRVQERQYRVCTTVAIAIVAETCSPFTILPALMNEYRVPELNVQNGVLKSLSFLFEYIGEMAKDYVYAVTPLLEDALMDRDLVHRQIACNSVKHMSLGVTGLGCEDALQHLLNYVWPNIFETSPHVINAVMEAIEGLRIALGPIALLQYTLQGLYHPARKVRTVYWKIYNNIYIGSQDALVAGYPLFSDDMNTENNTYTRDELLIFV